MKCTLFLKVIIRINGYIMKYEVDGKLIKYEMSMQSIM